MTTTYPNLSDNLKQRLQPAVADTGAGTELMALLNGKKLVTAVTAAGSTRTDAAALTGGTFNRVTSADGTKGAILPLASDGLPVWVFNAASSTLKVYPDTGGTINGGSTNASVNVAANTLAVFFPTAALTWTGNYTAGGTNATLTGVETLTNKTLTSPVVNGATGTGGTFTGAVLSTGTAGIGYATGAGAAVTQITSRSTGVTLSKISGQITTHNASLAAAAHADFIVTNTLVAATDVIIANIVPGGTGSPRVDVVNVAAGSYTLRVTNDHASTADTSADVINVVVIKGVAA